jgi:rare lipoprotein A (peptidoglycan hydrolase)
MIIFVLPGCHTKRVADRSASIQQETPPPWNYALPKPTFKRAPTFKQVGEASWYGPGFHGEKTANGEIFNQNKLTAAHRTLPLGTKAKVTSFKSGKSVEVKINDRGPYMRDRVIDLSRAAAKKLGMEKEGVTIVKVEANPLRRTGEGVSAQGSSASHSCWWGMVCYRRT